MGPKKIKKKFSKSKSVLPKMSARSGLAGKRTSRPHLGPSEAIFCVGRKNARNVKILFIFLGGPMGPIHPFWANREPSLTSTSPIHPWWGYWYLHREQIAASRQSDYLVDISKSVALNKFALFVLSKLRPKHHQIWQNKHNFVIFYIFPAHAKNGPRGPQMGPGGSFSGLKKYCRHFGQSGF